MSDNSTTNEILTILIDSLKIQADRYKELIGSIDVEHDKRKEYDKEILDIHNALTSLSNTSIVLQETEIAELKTNAENLIENLTNLTSIVQSKLDNGDFNGKDGITPKKGTDYFDGKTPVKGTDYNDGLDGKSAYEIAKENGFSGSVNEWLESLKVKGDKGKDAISVKKVDKVENDLVITLTDDSTHNVGNIANDYENLLNKPTINDFLDYEFGTWTPKLSKWSGGDIDAVYSFQHGKYMKIGDFVKLIFRIKVDTINSQGSSISYISGNPFPISSSEDSYLSVGTFSKSSCLEDLNKHFVLHSTNNSLIIRTEAQDNELKDFKEGTLYGSISFFI